MVQKYRVNCESCRQPIGFSFKQECFPTIYCFSCEDIETHRHEVREQDQKRYEAALRRS